MFSALRSGLCSRAAYAFTDLEEKLGREVRAVGPNGRLEFRVNSNFLEECEVLQRFKHLSIKMLFKIHQLYGTVLEG